MINELAKKSTEENVFYEQRYYNPRNDVAFKKIFVDHKNLTISFLNSILKLLGDHQIVDISFLPTEQLPMTAESKKSIVDIMCTDHRKHKYIIEVQNKYMLNFIQRIQHYGNHAFSGQLKVSENYIDIKPVTMLCVLNHSIFPSKIGYLSYHRNVESVTNHSYLNGTSYAFIELDKFTKKQEELQTDEDWWIYLMKEATHLRDLPPNAPEEIKQALNILEKHTWTQAENEAYEKARMAMLDDQDAIDSARIEAKIENSQEIAKKFIGMGLTLEQVSTGTGLTLEAVQELAEEMKDEKEQS